jgi:peroxiredoxin
MHKLLLSLAFLILLPTLHAEVDITQPLDLKFTAVDGTPVDFASLRGKVVLLDFWATWCPPCRGEVPHVVTAYKKFHAQGFEVVGISLDQDKAQLLAFTKKHGMTWPQYFDGQGWQNQISTQFGITAIPAMWLIGKDGKVITQDAREKLWKLVPEALKAQE